MNNMFNEQEFQKLTSVRKFYFLEYYYIFLKGIEQSSEEKEVFEYFKKLKEKYHLGNSRYKKNIFNNSDINISKKESSYKYTFQEVSIESITLNLITYKNGKYTLKDDGKLLLELFEKEPSSYYYNVFRLLEQKSKGFYTLVNSCYNANPNNNGLLILPTYAPLKLGILKKEFNDKSVVLDYCEKLYKVLEKDIANNLNKEISLKVANTIIVKKLFGSDLLENSKIQSGYYRIVARIRDYWLNYFITEIYNIDLSLTYFDIWTYRAKQLGILNRTEFYPNINGRVVYPISLISSKDIASLDFRKIFNYESSNENLFIHEPEWNETFIDKFIEVLHSSYYELKSKNKTYFVSLPDLKDIVCYKLKISNESFEEFLRKSYTLNLQNQIRIRISLESDRLPEETKAMYSIREGVLIEGVHRNIIAIDLK